MTSIVILADFNKLKADIPVFIEIEPDRFQVSEDSKRKEIPKKVAQKLIDSGPAGHADDAEFYYRAVSSSNSIFFPTRRWF